MRLTFLGTGTSFGVPQIGCDCAVCHSTDPRDKRTRSGVVLEASGSTILIDTPPELRLQLISGGVHQAEDGQFESFQINLVLADAVQPRLNLIEQDDLAETRTTASRVAEFLGIKLLDETLSAGRQGI